MRFENVRRVRRARGLPAAAVAQAAGKSLGWWYSVERGLTAPCRADAEAIAEVLDADADTLFAKIRDERDATT